MTGATGTSLGPNGHRYAETIQLQELFFGPAKYNTTNDPHALLDRVNNPLPVAWYDKDSNLRVQELLIQSVLATQERLLDWMPVTYHEGGNLFEFREVKFNLSLPDRIPEQGVPRLMTQNYSQWRASITRYGLAFIMEDGFRMTDMGRLLASNRVSSLFPSIGQPLIRVRSRRHPRLQCADAADQQRRDLSDVHGRAVRHAQPRHALHRRLPQEGQPLPVEVLPGGHEERDQHLCDDPQAQGGGPCDRTLQVARLQEPPRPARRHHLPARQR
jgi:hypothetical protein